MALACLQWVFSATAATIVSGAVAERCSFIAYLSYSAFMTSFVWVALGWAAHPTAHVHMPSRA
jgi:ammonia channel protein AmtB